MGNGVELETFVKEMVAAECIAVAAYFLRPWLWIPSVADNALLSVLLTTPFVVFSLFLLNPETYGISTKWTRRRP